MTFEKLIKDLFSNTSFIFLLAMVVGMLFNGGASWTEDALLPVLGVIMTVSVMDISLKEFLNIRAVVIPVLLSSILNYAVLGGIVIILSYLIVDDEPFKHGYVLLAAVPPAVAVVPFSYLLGGNMRVALVGNVGAYFVGLIVTPLICVLLLGSNLIEPTRLLVVLAELIVAPMAVTRIIRRTKVSSLVEKVHAPIINWGFFLVIYTMVGLKRDAFIEEPYAMLVLIAIAFAGIFVLAEIINRITMLFNVNKADRVSLILLSTRKNDGLAGVIALMFFDERAVMPIAVFTALSVLHFVWLKWRVKRMR